jgi:hypothetical protein
LPSEKVPAPPSPNCTFDSGSSTFLRHSPQVSCVRSRTALPRSRTIGRKAALREKQRGKEAGRAEADDDRPHRQRRRRLADEVIAHVGRRLQLPVAGKLREHCRFVGQRDVDAVDEGRRTRLARVATAPEDAEFDDVGRCDAEAGGDRRRQRCRRMLDRERRISLMRNMNDTG